MASGAQIVALFDAGADPTRRCSIAFFSRSRIRSGARFCSGSVTRHCSCPSSPPLSTSPCRRCPPHPGAGAGRAGAAATHRSHQPMQPPRGPDFRGGGLDQPLQQVLAGAIRDARRHAGEGSEPRRRKRHARGAEPRPAARFDCGQHRRKEVCDAISGTSERLAQYRRQISDLRGKIRDVQHSSSRRGGDYTFATVTDRFACRSCSATKRACSSSQYGRELSLLHLWPTVSTLAAAHRESRRLRRRVARRSAGAGEIQGIARLRFRMVSHRDSPSPPTWAIGATTAGCRACPCSRNRAKNRPGRGHVVRAG